MSRIALRRSWLSTGLLLLMTPGLTPAESYSPRVGQRHPDLTLPRIDTREAVSLSQFRGRKVLLIHFASW